MSDWTGEKVREWVLDVLHHNYREDPQNSVRWSMTTAPEATDSHPPGDDIVRACRTLGDCGWVEILTQSHGYIFVRMTSAGRDGWESFLRDREADGAAVLTLPVQ